jgi:hypothetical protein
MSEMEKEPRIKKAPRMTSTGGTTHKQRTDRDVELPANRPMPQKGK